MNSVHQKRLLSNDLFFYEEVTKNLNDYYIDLPDILGIKLIKEKNGDKFIEFHIFNDEFNIPLGIRNVPDEVVDFVLKTCMLHNILGLMDFFKNYAIIMSQEDISIRDKRYIDRLVRACSESIEKYEVCLFTVCDMSLPEYELNYVLVGNFTDKVVYNGMALITLSIEYSLKQIFPNEQNEFIKSMIHRYVQIFNEQYRVYDKKGKLIVH